MTLKSGPLVHLVQEGGSSLKGVPRCSIGQLVRLVEVSLCATSVSLVTAAAGARESRARGAATAGRLPGLSCGRVVPWLWWLSVGKCLDRLLEQWPALLKFFTSKESPSSSVTKDSSGAHPGGPDKKAQPHSDRPHERAQSNSAQQTTVTAQLKQSQVHKKPGPKQMPSISGKLVHTSIPTKQKVCSKESSAKAQEEGHCQKLKRPSSDSQKKSLSTSGKTKPRESMPLSTKQDRIKSCFERASTKLYCLFLQASIPAFDKLNLLLQSDKPNIHVLGRELQAIYTDLLCKFVKPAVLVAASSVYTVDFRSLNNQKSENDLVIGTKTRQYLHACIADKSLQHEDVKLFYSSVKAYFSEACTYMQKKFPLQDELLRNAQVADISQHWTL
ncbi:UNVERIFIED_CONTAM: hypothetical protein FKN15_037028 [Acipenser sinensis]